MCRLVLIGVRYQRTCSFVGMGGLVMGWLCMMFFVNAVQAQPPQQTKGELSNLTQARAFHRRQPVVDWHVDTLHHITRRWYDLKRRQPRYDVDIPRMRQGGLGAQVFSLWVPPRILQTPEGGWRYLLRMYRTFQKMVKSSGGMLVQARTADDVRRIHAQGKIAALLGLEGAHPLEGRLDRVKTLASWGVVYVGLTWNNSNAFATSALDELRRKKSQPRGLTELGRKLVRELETYRILVDVSHAGPRTFWDIAGMAKRPWIASHSNAHRVCSHFRNLNDKQLHAIAKVNGIVGINFYTLFLRNGRTHREATLKDVVRHIRHIVSVVGIDHVALGSDFDGITSKPKGLADVSQLPALTVALQKHGFSLADIRKILSENSLRVLSP